MQLHQIQRDHPLKTEKRIGRGGKRGHYSGRGIKGQKARAGRKLPLQIKEWLKRYHKLRGFKFNPLPEKEKIAEVNLETLEAKFQEGEVVSPQSLLEKKIIRKVKGKVPKVKILGRGGLSKKLVFKNCLFSQKALLKVKDLGCEIKS